MLKTAILGIGSLFAGVALLAGWGGAVTACQNLDETSPLFDAAAATDYDAGYVPPASTDDPGSSSGTPPSGPAANTLRVRLVNLTQGGQALQLCVAQAPSTAFVVAQDVITSSKLDAVGAGLVSAPVNIGPITTAATGKFQFKVGPDCATPIAAVLTVSPSAAFIKAGASVTLIVAGDPADTDPTAPLAPRLTSVNDVVTPSATATSLRAVHGAVGLPPFDLVVNGETVLTGIRYNTAVPLLSAPGYTANPATGFIQIPAGIAEGSTVLLRSGTTVKSFTVPERIRRGVADTLVVTGSSVNNVAASICSDRAPAAGATSADCIVLNPG
jgi:hypothetical protein